MAVRMEKRVLSEILGMWGGRCCTCITGLGAGRQVMLLTELGDSKGHSAH